LYYLGIEGASLFRTVSLNPFWS